MAEVKIKSNPYERKIEFLSYKEQNGKKFRKAIQTAS